MPLAEVLVVRRTTASNARLVVALLALSAQAGRHREGRVRQDTPRRRIT